MTLAIAVECALKYFSIFLNHNRKGKQAVVTCVVYDSLCIYI